MRDRNPDSNSTSARPLSDRPLEPEDCWVYFVTEKGLRASGAASMKATAASLRETARELEKAAKRLNQDVPASPNGSSDTRPQVFRRGTVCGRYRRENRVPDLRLSGKWLGQAGFGLGQKFQVKVDDRRLTVYAE